MNFYKAQHHSAAIVFVCLFLGSCSHYSRNDPGTAPDNAESALVEPELVKAIQPLKFLPESITQNEASIALTTPEPFYQLVLANGLTVDYLPDPALPKISIALVVDTGKYQFNSRDENVSPLVLKLLKQGTRKYSKKEFQQQVSLLGKPLQYRQTAQFSIISAEILSQDLEHSLSLLAEQLTDIDPGPEALKAVIEQQLLENKLTQSSGSYLARLLFYQQHYPPEHLYYRAQPDSKEVKSVKAAELLEFYYNWYRPEKSRLIISGDFDPEALRALIERHFVKQNLKHKQVKPLLKTRKPESKWLGNKKSQLYFVERKGARQVDLLYGVVTVPVQSTDWAGLKIIATLLGGGPGSRLFADLREQQGLAYYISAQQLAGRYSSPFFIKTSVAHNNLIPMIQGINRHINALCDNKIDPYELRQIKQQLSGEIVLKQQTSQQRLAQKINQYENILADNYLMALEAEINNTTVEQLFDIANRYLCGSHTIIAVGQSNKLLKNFQYKLKDYVYIHDI